MDEFAPPRRRLLNRRRQRCRLYAWVMFVAFLPALTYVGHWEFPHFDIPGTNLYIGLPGATHAQGEPGHSHTSTSTSTTDHSQHGHGESGGQGARAGAPAIAALLDETVMFFGLTLVAAAVAFAWRPARVLTISPRLRPPRALVLA